MGSKRSTGPRAGIGGRPAAQFCVRGHDLSVTRRRFGNGATYCAECRRINRKAKQSSHGPRAGIGGPAGEKCRRGHDMSAHRVIDKAGRKRCGLCDQIHGREYREKNLTAVRASRLRKYGLTLDQFIAMEWDQGGVCAICFTRPEGKVLSVDHCHKTNKVRALLCPNCNSMIGQAKDDPDVLERAAEYVRRHATNH